MVDCCLVPCVVLLCVVSCVELCWFGLIWLCIVDSVFVL